MLRFGIELEVASITFETAKGILNKLQYPNYSFHDVGTPPYEERLRLWITKGDCTISPSGVEFNSPILEWHERLQVMPLIKEIRRSGAIANHTCGLHIHMSGDFPSYESSLPTFGNWYEAHKKEFEPCEYRKNHYVRHLNNFIKDRGTNHIEIRMFDAKLDCRWMSRCLTICRQLGIVLERNNN